MTTFTALALDPGGTTGWAYYRAMKMQPPFTLSGGGTSVGEWLEKNPPEWYDEEWKVGQLGPGDHADELLTLLELNHTSEYHVIVERFVERPNKIGAKHEESPRYITITEMFCRERQVDFIRQMPAAGKNFVKDRNIKNLDLWFPGQRHAMDAMRHLLFWLTTGPYKRVDLLEKGWKD